MKIYLTKINESWIIDRIKNEWTVNNKKITTKNPYFSEIIWDIAPWASKPTFIKKFKNKKIIQSIYHIENTSPEGREVKNIIENDKFIDGYHVISKKTKEVLQNFTKKTIFYLPLWVNQDIWYNKSNKNELRTNFGFTGSDYLVGSFQRDTEGSDLRSPKLVKGPDIFIEIVKNLYKKNNKLRVVLTGKRRDYVISELKKNNIPYKYFEMTNFSMMNDLYNILDLYLITSRLEGGPQALVECGQTRTPVISTDVGIAREILGADSIFDYKNISSFNEASPNVEKAYIESSTLTIPNGMLGYVDMFSRVYEG
jgi:glycosyltransferase involved in cell wall biosynthesis